MGFKNGTYCKDGNIVTLRKSDKSTRIFHFVFSTFFWIPFALGGFIMLDTLISQDIYAETKEKVSILEKISFFFFLIVPFFFISYLIISGFRESLNDLIYPNSFKVDINTKVCTFENGRKKLKISFEPNSFSKICYDLIRINMGEDDDYHLKSWIEGDDSIIYFINRSYDDSVTILDLKDVSNYLGIPLINNDTLMQDEEYKIFRKQEIEDTQNDTRQKYYLL